LPEEKIRRHHYPEAAHQGGNIVIEVSDDGAGLNREWILEVARKRACRSADGMTDNEVWQTDLCARFLHGNYCFRRFRARRRHGCGQEKYRKPRCRVKSLALRPGLHITVRLPLTLAILDGMSIAVGDQIYIIPLSFIIESFQPRQATSMASAGNRASGARARRISAGGRVAQTLQHQDQDHRSNGRMLVMLETEGKASGLVC